MRGMDLEGVARGKRIRTDPAPWIGAKGKGNLDTTIPPVAVPRRGMPQSTQSDSDPRLLSAGKQATFAPDTRIP